MNNSMYIDIHAIQTLPPSCVNRDDTGTPKTAIYGGVERARVSSQAWKHAMREYFKTIFSDDDLGIRTKLVHKLIAEEIQKKKPDFDDKKCLDLAKRVLEIAIISKKNSESKKNNEGESKLQSNKNEEVAPSNSNGKKDKEKTLAFDDREDQYKTLLFISKKQIEQLASVIIDNKEKDTAACKDALKASPSLDIALFGRMVADDSSLNYDAAAQVAHAISTHEVQMEYDYFTAIDDYRAEDKNGAAHLDTVSFNSATLYRFATVNVPELAINLGGDIAKVVRGFIEAFVFSMPTGKQNAFANRTLPDMLYVTVRRDQPINFAGAFENAVKNNDGYVKESCERLIAHADKLYGSFAEKPELALGCGDSSVLSGHAEIMPMNDLLNKVEDYVSDFCKEVSK